MTFVLFLLDLLLALGATLRLTRFVVADDVPGTWFIKDPLRDRNYAHLRRQSERGVTDPQPARWARYVEGLSCPYCVSVWAAAAVTVALLLAGGPGHGADWWRYVAGFLTLAWMTGHIAARVGDTEDD